MQEPSKLKILKPIKLILQNKDCLVFYDLIKMSKNILTAIKTIKYASKIPIFFDINSP